MDFPSFHKKICSFLRKCDMLDTARSVQLSQAMIAVSSEAAMLLQLLSQFPECYGILDTAVLLLCATARKSGYMNKEGMIRMKRWMGIFISALLICTLAACGSGPTSGGETTAATTAQTTAALPREGWITADSLRVRSGPGHSQEIIGGAGVHHLAFFKSTVRTSHGSTPP